MNLLNHFLKDNKTNSVQVKPFATGKEIVLVVPAIYITYTWNKGASEKLDKKLTKRKASFKDKPKCVLENSQCIIE